MMLNQTEDLLKMVGEDSKQKVETKDLSVEPLMSKSVSERLLQELGAAKSMSP